PHVVDERPRRDRRRRGNRARRQAREHSVDGARRRRRGRRHQQRGRRLPDHGSHAADVQEKPSHQGMRMGPASDNLIEIVYLVASALFILSLKWMSSPATARRGVWAGEAGMLLAIGGTLLHHGIVDYTWIAVALVLGTLIGIPLGLVQMTAVPQRTALSHAAGALCVTLVGTAEFYLRSPDVPRLTMGVLSAEVILGGLTF